MALGGPGGSEAHPGFFGILFMLSTDHCTVVCKVKTN